ncbi:DUF2279 domain-containing protein [Sulfurovum sp.]|uniref:DUF2279 domain-containing protein n=1 Tax=Sulfurovum sp. TaxID=1969726 RepID=UPI0025FA20AF|nr:DUF2279 domain-containing protein [Sulfurovum sp.]
MKKLILIPVVSASLIAGGHIPNSKAGEDTAAGTQERTWTEAILFKPEKPLTDEELRTRVLYTNLIGAGLVAAWGTAFWDYFTIKPVVKNEGWFGKDTKYGGADKFGHMYSTYLWSLGFSSLYEYWGMHEDEALLYGPLTSWTFQALMEVGDSFSASQGFSYEDLIMNTVGAAFYYVREKYPTVKSKLDFRLEYIPDFNSNVDFFTQYNSMKYLMALKFSGFKSMEDTPMKYLELQLGYYTRGYQAHEDYLDKERVVYVGVGINSSEVLKAIGWEKTSKIFNYYQLPYTYIPFGYDYDTQGYVQPYSRPYFGNKK